MKKTLTLFGCLALAGLASAETPTVDLLYVDFTSLTETPTGWTTGQWNGNNTPHYQYNENGALVRYPWKQNNISTAIDITSGTDYTITFSLYATQVDNGNEFFLSSDTYSVVLGNSYNSNNYVSVGTLDSAVGDTFVSFQTGTGTNPTVSSTSQGSQVNVGGITTYTLNITGNTMSIAVVDASGNQWSSELELKENFSFNKIGFINDGPTGAVGVQNIRVTATLPEPATATLGLLALAGLAARRRRK